MVVLRSCMKALLREWRRSPGRPGEGEQEESMVEGLRCLEFRERVEGGGGIVQASYCCRCMTSVLSGITKS